MATPQLSPGVLIREVDLTVGRADNVLDNIGAIAGPFSMGPVDQPIDIATEAQLINTFGKPLSTDGQYEYWMTASSFLSYGGVLKVVRTGSSNLNNANAAVGYAATTSLKIDNYDDYTANHSADSVNYAFAAKNPGSWANNMKICVIDNKADQTIGINTTSPSNSGAVIGYGVTVAVTGVTIPGDGVTNTFTGYLKGIITGVTTDSTNGSSSIDVRIFSRVSSAGTETQINYQQSNRSSSFNSNDSLKFINNSGVVTGTTMTAGSVVDWYDQQTLGLSNSTVYWKSIAPKPGTSSYASERQCENDEVHVVVYDDRGTITGIQGNLLEKHVGLSKASDATSAVNSPQKIFWKNYIADNSAYIYAGDNPSVGSDLYNGVVPRPAGFSTAFVANTESDGQWNVSAQGKTFSSIGNVSYTLGSGVDYTSPGNGMEIGRAHV